MGHIYRRPGKTIWMLKYYRSGVPVYESSKTASYEEAERRLKIKEGRIAEGSAPSIAGSRITVDAAADLIREDYEVNGRAYRSRLEGKLVTHILPALGPRKLASLGTADLTRYRLRRLRAGAAVATVNRELAILRRIFHLAHHAGLLTTIPHVPMLCERNARRGFFEREAFEAVRDYLAPPLRPLVTVAYWTGWRVASELLPMQWRQVDRQAQTLRLEPHTTKNDEGRTFPYGAIPELAAVMQTLWEAKSDGPAVFHRNGVPIRDFREAWKSAVSAAGVPERIPHDFRRTAVRNLVRAGVPEKVAMVLTGHKTRSVFDRYDIIRLDDLSAATRLLAKYGE